MKEDEGMFSVDIEPSVFLTNLPGIIGFYPKGQVVIAALYDVDDIGVLIAPDSRVLSEYAGPMLIKGLEELEASPESIVAAGDFLLEEGCTRADVYIIDESWGIERTSTSVVQGLLDCGLAEVRLAGVSQIAAGEVVTDAKGDIVGIVGDSLMSPGARRLSENGEKICDSYKEFRHRFERGQFKDEEDQETMRRIQERATVTVEPRPLRIGSHNEALKEYFSQFVTAVEDVAEGKRNIDDVLRSEEAGVAIAASLTNVTLRDMSMMMVSSSLRDTATKLWLAAAAVYSGYPRANALACYAISQFAHGNETYAQSALTEAAREAPDHSLTQLLDLAVSSHMISRCIGTIVGAAHEVIRRVYGIKSPRSGGIDPDRGFFGEWD
nr:DUF4192 domain-containing protein [Corynebacterium lactis]